MRKLITSGIGLFCGLLVIIMAFFIQVNPVTLETESFAKLYSAKEDPYYVPDNYSGSSERDKYYGGDAVGISAIFSTADSFEGFPIYSVFNPNDLPDYQSFPAHECPQCREGKKLDALVNGFGYSKI